MITSYEKADQLRVFIFITLFIFFMIIGLLRPAITFVKSDKIRVFSHLLLTLLNSIFVKLVFPLTLIDISLWSTELKVGIFNILPVAEWVNTFLSVILLDLIIYWQHRIFHQVKWLWRFHRIHHEDQIFDTSTALRFHTVEILLSFIIKIVAVFLLGVNVWGILIFEVLLNATAMFNHSNFKLPVMIERPLRFILVTPCMHRVHHTIIPKEMHSNFGFNFSFWDRLFNSYRHKSKLNPLSFGIENIPQVSGLWSLLMRPFTLSKK